MRPSLKVVKAAAEAAFQLSGGDYQLAEHDSGLHTAALSAFKFVNQKVAAS
jgi:hypothetical protein